jgi:formylglycine-generating enzyme required for sulfatase activity
MVQEFIRLLNAREAILKYRLPTEAEWEYAGAGRINDAVQFGDNEALLEQYAWYNRNDGAQHILWGSSNPMPGACTTCRGTSGNGCRTGVDRIS